MNQIFLVGRLVLDPQPQINETTITLAVKRTYKNEEGVYDTDFIPVILHDILATQTIEYCKKGNMVGIKGRIETNTTIDPLTLDNEREVIIIADKVTFISQARNEENDN